MLGLFSTLAGCATAQPLSSQQGGPEPALPVSAVPQGPEVMGPPEPFGPPISPPAAANGISPIPVAQERSVVLVLGPGMARGFAYVGVLQALHDAKIPIGAILGTEMGGLIGAVYATSHSINQFEWALLKLKEELFVSKGLLSGVSEVSDGQALDGFIKQVFGKKEFSSTFIPLRIGVKLNPDWGAAVIDHGGLLQAVRATIALPGVLAPVKFEWEGKNYTGSSSGKERPFLIEEAKALGIGPIIVVNVLSKKESEASRDALAQADYELKPDLKGINYSDFKRKTDAAFRGKKAVFQNIIEIRRVLGGVIIRE